MTDLYTPRTTRHSSRSAKASSRPRRARLDLEQLEGRLVPAVFNVNSLADVLNPGPGVVTLRSAIQAADTNGQANNVINLTLPGTYKITLPGTLNETDNAAGEFAITGTGNLLVQNASGGRVVIDGGGHSRVFDVNPAAQNTTPFTVTFQGLVITGGAAAPGDLNQGSGGGIRAQGAASLVLTNDVIINNTATADGGGVALESVNNDGTGTLTVNASVISNNHAGDAGGGIETDGTGLVQVNPGSVISFNTCVNQGAGIWLDAGTANLVVTGSVISNNTAINMLAGGIGNAGTGNVTIDDSVVENNFSGGTGGGFGDASGKGTLTVTNSLFLDNTAALGGGAIQAGEPMVSISYSTFVGNTADGTTPASSGGALLLTGAANQQQTTITASRFAQNVGVNGGAIEDLDPNGTALTIIFSLFQANRATGANGDNMNATGPGGAGGAIDEPGASNLVISNCLFLDDTASNAGNGNGGAINQLGGSLTITASQFTGDFASGSGGAINFSGANIMVGQSTFNGDTALGNGGAIAFASANPATLQNDTFVGNTAGVNGGAVFDSGSALGLLADTVNGNTAGNVGGGISVFNGGSLTIQNTIVFGNTAGFGAPDVFSLTITDKGGNLIGVAPPGFGAGTQVGVDPRLGPLENNGGFFAGLPGSNFVVQTEALLAGSPAVGKGVAAGEPTTDERGFARPGMSPSVGAFEPQFTLGKTPNALFVESVYEVLFNRPADPGAAGWVNLLNAGFSPTLVVFDLEQSTEYRTAEVQALYQRYLHRQADPGGLGAFVHFLQAGGTVEQAATALVGSQEYFDLHGGTVEGFLDGLYEDALGRAPDPTGLSSFSQALAGGMSRGALAGLVLGSPEYLMDLVEGDYQALLGRPADPQGLAAFTGALQQGATDEQVLAVLLGSGEAFGHRS